MPARPGRRARPKPRRYASAADAAEYANVSSRTVRRWMANGLLTGYRVGPRLIKYDLDEVDQLIRPVPNASR
jgi:excisionase family DNA binding protein